MTADAKKGDKVIKNTGEVYILADDYNHVIDF